MKNDYMVMKSARGRGRRAAEFGSFNGWGRPYFVSTLVGMLCLFQKVGKFCSLVSAQGVYLF